MLGKSGRIGLTLSVQIQNITEGGGRPSTLVEAEAGSMRRLHTKNCMAAVARRAVQREVQARATDRRRDPGVDDALWFAKGRMKVTASSLQRPPISIPSTTNRAHPAPIPFLRLLDDLKTGFCGQNSHVFDLIFPGLWYGTGIRHMYKL